MYELVYAPASFVDRMIPPLSTARRAIRFRPWLFGSARLALLCACLGWLYGWARPVAYPTGRRLGLVYGIAHGALMPMAFPSLIMGRDVPIYSENNTGRSYKLGYIVGINICGLVVFGSAFWRVGRKPPPEPGPHISAPR